MVIAQRQKWNGRRGWSKKLLKPWRQGSREKAENREIEGRARTRIHPPRSYTSNTIPPTRPHIPTAHLAINSSMD